MGPGKVCTDINITIFEEVNMGINNLEVDKTEETAAEFQGSGKPTGFESVKNIIADKLHSVAEGLGENGADLDGEPGMAKYRKQASEWLDHSAEYVRKFDYKQADAGIREYVKQSPGRSLFIAGTVGLIIGAILRRR
jgi:ElaB/YqjD/DUF883 family membrane-anchored ribosome-binding protein